MNRIPEQLEQLRAQIDLSKSDLAEKSEKSRSAVVAALTGAKDTQLSVIEAIARVLGVEFVAVPTALAPEVRHFVAAGGRALAQPAGVDAPKSAADLLKAGVKEEPRAAPPRARIKKVTLLTPQEMTFAPALTWPELEPHVQLPAGDPSESGADEQGSELVTLRDFVEDPTIAVAAEQSRAVARALDTGAELPQSTTEDAQ